MFHTDGYIFCYIESIGHASTPVEYGYSFSTSSGELSVSVIFLLMHCASNFLAPSGLENMNLHLLSVFEFDNLLICWLIDVSLTSYTVMGLSSGRFDIFRLSEESFSDYFLLLGRSIMARALVQSTSIPSSVAGERTTKFNGSGKTKRAVTMLCNAQSSSLTLRDFTGLRGCNAIDTLVRSGQTLQSKVAAATYVRRPRGCRFVPKAMFERFTEKAIKVIMLAQEEARRLGHNFVGTEQILLGLIGEGTGIAAKVLKSMGINLKDARVEVEKIIGRGSGFVAVEIPFTPRAKRVLELSLEEARQLGHNYIGSEHLLLGLLREGEGVAARVLENLGADPSNIRTQASSRSRMLPLGSLILCFCGKLDCLASP
ncbi:hypothetical protein MTR67_051151 [Solanum verrucosum]|uniref:Clp R domain-containing protein n=1 Tax=Solanum verrucosum TaxID=315347 RepID=A0AAF0ZZV8_SOLVR|nr:hypothetical protein MTR67_051151 [Solanum verrucosum]